MDNDILANGAAPMTLATKIEVTEAEEREDIKDVSEASLARQFAKTDIWRGLAARIHADIAGYERCDYLTDEMDATRVAEEFRVSKRVAYALSDYVGLIDQYLDMQDASELDLAPSVQGLSRKVGR
jgi:hypothetical protein